MAYDQDISEAIAVPESGGNYNARNPESTASGKYQFIRSTFEGVKKNNPDLPNVSWEQFQKDPSAQESYQQALLTENTNALKKQGLEVTPANQYIMHWLGSPKASALLKGKDDQILGDFLSQNVLQKNRLTPDTTLSSFKQTVSDKMNSALAKRQPSATQQATAPTQTQADIAMVALNAQKQQKGLLEKTAYTPLEPTGNVTSEEAQQVSGVGLGSGLKLSPAPLTVESSKALDFLQESTDRIRKLTQGGPEKNVLVADLMQEGMKEHGPNWGMAFASALFGDKQGALNWITGGAESRPQIAEGLVNGVPQQVWIKSNARGDTWYLDPKTGKRLPDNTQITATTPEGAIATGQAGRAIKATGRSGQFTLPETNAHEAVGGLVQERASNLPTEQRLLTDINSRNRQFKDALNNALRNPQSETALKIINSIKGGIVDENKIKEAATLVNIPPEQRGEFAQFLRDIVAINKNDEQHIGKHGPGAGAHGALDLEGGAKGIDQWLANRTTSYGFQQAWNNFYDQNKETKTVPQIINDFKSSDTYRGIENYRSIFRDKLAGKKPSLKDGDPVVDFDRSGKQVMKRFNAQTGKAE